MPETKLIEGYLEYIKRCDDPNLKACIEKHGDEFIIHSIDVWRSETPSKDHDSIPVQGILRELKSNLLQP